ncbi:MAG: sulfotransferase [Gammaproteobacteria bacterium]|nr:MAG: sulfotransferase [Gammaproteobacteria bacterium]
MFFRKSISRPFKVNFLVAGTQKGGTTALDSHLRKHQSICMAQRKEVHFFDRDELFNNGVDYSSYHAFFEPKNSHKLIGESTPIYMYWREAPKRICEYNPEMKILIVLRNPIERAYSHWNMERDRGKEHLTFWDAITNEEVRCHSESSKQHRIFSYVDRGFYAAQIKRIWQYFPRKQTLFIKHDDLKNSPNKTLKTISAFLEIESFPHIEPHEIHSRPYISSINSQEKLYLLEKFSEDIKVLEFMLGWDCSSWTQ